MKTLAGIEALPVTSRLFELDVLRGFAILLVLGVHNPGVPGESGLLRPLDGLLHRIGWTGVDLFFVLSGFLLGRLLFSEIEATGKLDVGRFLIRRMFRIWPGYYVFLLFVLVRLSFEVEGGGAESWRLMAPAFVHIQDFVPAPRDQLWSLAVEEHFYLALPFLLWFLLSRRKDGAAIHAVPWICFSLSVLLFVLRVWLAVTTTDINVRVFLSYDALFFGVNLAYLSVFRPAVLPAIAKHRGLLLAAGCLLLVPAVFIRDEIRHTIGFTTPYLGYTLILITFVHKLPQGGLVERWKSTRSAKFVALVGTYSYSIYLWHRDTSYGAYELARSVGRALGWPGELTWVFHTLAYMGAGILGGVIMNHLVEAPALHIRDKLFPFRALGIETPPVPFRNLAIDSTSAAQSTQNGACVDRELPYR